MKPILSNQSGLTLVEVLVSAIVFMLGLSIMVVMIGNATEQYSARDMILASNIGEELLQVYSSQPNEQIIDTVINRSGLAFRLTGSIYRRDELLALHLSISRVKKEKQLLELYYEFSPTKEQPRLDHY